MIQADRHPRKLLTPRRPSAVLPVAEPIVFPIEAAAAPLATPMASLLTRHQLRDGEVVILVLKPSVWLILLTSLRFIAATMIVAIAARLWMHANTHLCVDGTVFCVAGRLMLASLAWFGRLYVLTDQRVLRISGVLNVEICDCPLRKVARTRVLRTLSDKLLGLGTVEIIPQEEARQCAVWQTISRPIQVNDRLNETIRRAKAG